MTAVSSKRFVSFFVALAIFLATFCLTSVSGGGFVVFAGAEELENLDPDPASFKIDTTLLRVGEEISVTADFDIASLKWYVDGELVSDQLSFTPTSDDYEKWIKAEAYDGDVLIAEDSAYFSKLPVVYINTDDGEDITDKEEYKTATMKVQNNGICTYTEYDDAIEIKGRGNSSWNWSKKPYKIKLDSKTDMFGMGKNKHWVLLANYLDESLIRNRTGFEIAKQLGLIAMDSEWVDVVLNGSYVGNYLLCEHIRIGTDRVDIFDWESEAEDVAAAVYKKEKSTLTKDDKSNLETLLAEDLSWVTTDEFEYNGKTYTVSDYYELDHDISGGYLIEFSNEYDEVSRFTTQNGLMAMLNKPEFLATNGDMMDYVAGYIQNLENAYRSPDGYTNINGVDHHYTEFVDLDSIVSYWLVNEIMGNQDAAAKSRYAYLDFDSKLRFGPVWDFDWGAASAGVDGDPTIWRVSKVSSDQNFFKEYTDDPLFICKATEKYWEIRDYLVSIVSDDGIMDDWYDYLCESGRADKACWDRSVSFAASRGFDDDYSVFRKFLADRIEWMDLQFSSDTVLLDSVRSSASACTYYKSDKKLALSVVNGAADDSDAAKAPADYLINKSGNVTMYVNVNDRMISETEVYVNGLYHSTVTVPSSRDAIVTIDYGAFTEPIGKKNVISAIAKNADGDIICTNFITVKASDEHIQIECKHIWSEWEITEEAVFDEAGSKTRTCAVCGETETEKYYLVLNGTTGDCTWSFEGDTLTISGNGAMDNYANVGNIPPWQTELRTYIKHIVIEDGVTGIGSRAFKGCNRLISVTFGKDVKTVGHECFYGCTKLTSVTLNEGLERIGALMFYNCGFTSIEIPSTVNNIATRAFKACAKLESIDIPDAVTYLGYEVFMDCTSLVEAEFTTGAGYVNSMMFSGCTALKEFYVPANITQLRANTFMDCTALELVEFEDDDNLYPNSNGAALASNTFGGCDKTKLVIKGWYYGKAAAYASARGFIFEAKNTSKFKYTVNEDGETITVTGMRGDSTTASIPETIDGYTVTAIGNAAFRDSAITKLMIPNTVKTIKGRAFQGSEIITVSVPASVTDIEYSAFEGCTELTSITVGASTATVHNSAFTGCTNATVYAPAGSAAAKAAAAAGIPVVS